MHQGKRKLFSSCTGNDYTILIDMLSLESM